MKKSVRNDNILLAINLIMISAVFVLNYFYQSNGFDFTLKCICSAGFALLGIINLVYAAVNKSGDIKFSAVMAAGLVFAMLGDVIIGVSFIFGAGIFALGHVCFVAAYCVLQKPKALDFIIGGVLFVGAGAFLIFFPLLDFDEPIFRWVCVVYALIISSMLGKAAANFIRVRNVFYALIAVGSLLFFFSDLMLVFDWFVGIWQFTSEACMGTYYPALCLLAFSIFFKGRTERAKL